ncbi:MAG: AI-2E family transporter [Planctomycetota bacterium]
MTEAATPARRPDVDLTAAALLVLAALGVLGAMYLLKGVLVPFVLAIFIALMLNPLVDYQVRRLRWPRPVAVSVTFAAGLVALAAALLAVLPIATRAVSAIAEYEDPLGKTTVYVLDRLPVELDDATRADLIAEITVYGGPEGFRALLPFVGSAGSGMLTLVSNAGLVGVFLLFLLLGRGDKPVPADSVRGQIERRIQAYLSVTFVVSLATGFLTGLTLWLLGVKLAWLFGLLAFALNFIPTVGSAVATLLPVPMILFGQDLSTAAIVAALIIPAVIQFVLGNIVAPKMLGDRLQLSPVAVMLALLLLGAIWGIVGMILATPMLAVFKIAIDRLSPSNPLLGKVSISLSSDS